MDPKRNKTSSKGQPAKTSGIKPAKKAPAKKPPVEESTSKPPDSQSPARSTPRIRGASASSAHGTYSPVEKEFAIQRLKEMGFDWAKGGGNGSNNPRLFQQVLIEARRFLAEVDRPTATVHAYQLFQQGAGLQSPKTVEKRFEEVGWKFSHNTIDDAVNEVMEGVMQAVRREEENLEQLILVRSDAPLKHKIIRETVGYYMTVLVRRLGFSLIVTDLEKLTSQVVDLIKSQVEERLPTLTKASLGSIVHDLNYSSKFPEYAAPGFAKGSSDRSFRPYEVFLFAAQNGVLPDKLVAKLHHLHPDFIPASPVDLGLSILNTYDAPPV